MNINLTEEIQSFVSNHVYSHAATKSEFKLTMQLRPAYTKQRDLVKWYFFCNFLGFFGVLKWVLKGQQGILL